MACFPLFIDMKDSYVCIFGGGRIALQKVHVLMQFSPAIKIVAPYICDELKSMSEENADLCLVEKEFSSTDTTKWFIENRPTFVVAATDDRNVNIMISELCKSLYIPVNVVDDKALCTFYFSSIIKNDDVVCAVSSGGTSPYIAKYLKSLMENVIPEKIGIIAKRLDKMRPFVKEKISMQKSRAIVFQKLFDKLLNDENMTSDEDLISIVEDSI